MNIESADPRAQRTRLALIGAMEALLSERDAIDISITEIVARARVSRPSFYQHFGDIPTLVVATGIARIERLFADNDTRFAHLTGAEFGRRTIDNIVHELQRDHVFYRRLLHGVGSYDISRSVIAFLEARMQGRRDTALFSEATLADADRLTAIAAGISWLIIRWLDSGFEGDDTPDRMAERLSHTIASLAGASPAPAL